MIRQALLCCLFTFAFASASAAQDRPSRDSGAPAKITAKPPSLDAYGNLPAIEAMALPPGGRGLAFVGRVKGERQLMVLDREMRMRRTLPIGEAKLRSFDWAGNDRLVLTIGSTKDLPIDFVQSKVEFYNSYVLDLEAQSVEPVFRKSKSMMDATWGNFGLREADGKWFGFFGGVEYKYDSYSARYVFESGKPHLYRIEIDGLSRSKIAPAGANDHVRSWLVDSNGEVAGTLDRELETGRWSIVNAGGTRIAQGTDPANRVSLAALGENGDSVIYWTQSPEDGKSRLFQVPLAGGPASTFLAGDEVEQLYVDRVNGRLLGYRLDGPNPLPVMFDPKRQHVMNKVFAAFRGKNLEIMDWTSDFSHVLLRTSGNGDPGSWFLVDVGKLSATQVGDERPGIPLSMVGKISTFSYTAADGLAIDAILTLPPGREPRNLPVVILPHGGPNTHDTTSFDWWAQAFASRGYAVLQPNFRGSTNKDAAFMRAGNGQWGRAMQTDLSDGLRALAAKGIVDPHRACIMGASYGGYAALAGVTLQQGIYRCAVAVAPVSDLQAMVWDRFEMSGRNRGAGYRLRESLGPASGFDAVSPRKHADSADAPVMIIHGKDDTVVPFAQGERMADALKSAGKVYEFIELDGEDHWLSRAETRKQMLRESMRFVQAHNPAD